MLTLPWLFRVNTGQYHLTCFITGLEIRMFVCPICLVGLETHSVAKHNCYRCQTCNVFVYAICDPDDYTIWYPALSNDNEKPVNVPNNVLLSTIIDQSPIKDPPRILMLEFNGKSACLYAGPSSDSDKFSKRWCRKAEKTAFIFERQMFLTKLPLELMDRVRRRNDNPCAG